MEHIDNDREAFMRENPGFAQTVEEELEKCGERVGHDMERVRVVSRLSEISEIQRNEERNDV